MLLLLSVGELSSLCALLPSSRKMAVKERFELVPRDEVHAVVKIDVARARNVIRHPPRLEAQPSHNVIEVLFAPTLGRVRMDSMTMMHPASRAVAAAPNGERWRYMLQTASRRSAAASAPHRPIQRCGSPARERAIDQELIGLRRGQTNVLAQRFAGLLRAISGLRRRLDDHSD